MAVWVCVWEETQTLPVSGWHGSSLNKPDRQRRTAFEGKPDAESGFGMLASQCRQDVD